MPPQLDPGQLRHRVTLERITSRTKDSVGELQPVWTAVGDYFAFVNPLSGRELWNAQQVTPLVSHSVTMRNIGPMSSLDRLFFEGRILELNSVMRVGERNEWYAILATEQPVPASS